MVLELHAPKDASPAALLALWPQLATYVVSFAFVATYWVNHRYLFSHLKGVDERVLWSNMVLLFTLSLIPFAVAYVGDLGLVPFPTAVYAAVMLVNALAYTLLARAIEAQHHASERPPAFQQRSRIVGYAAAAAYAAAIPAAFFDPWISLALIFAVSLYYMTPISRP